MIASEIYGMVTTKYKRIPDVSTTRTIQPKVVFSKMCSFCKIVMEKIKTVPIKQFCGFIHHFHKIAVECRQMHSLTVMKKIQVIDKSKFG